MRGVVDWCVLRAGADSHLLLLSSAPLSHGSLLVAGDSHCIEGCDWRTIALPESRELQGVQGVSCFATSSMLEAEMEHVDEIQ